MIEGHGDDGYAFPRIEYDFSSNVPPAEELQRYLLSSLAPHLQRLTHYPPPRAFALERALEDRLELSPGTVLVTSGATEAIYMVAQWMAARCVERHPQSYIVEPTFAEYASAARGHQHGVHQVLSLEACPGNADGVWICNPNNPTGTVWPPSAVLSLLERLESGFLVMDASYSYFTQEPQLQPKDVLAHRNLLLVGSMTKKYAMPGLRLGYVIASPMIIAELAHLVRPWSVNPLAQLAGEILLDCPQSLLPNTTLLLRERERIQRAVGSFRHFEGLDSRTHFMLIRWDNGPAARLKEWLAHQRHILVRNADNFHSLGSGFFRVSARGSVENDQLLEALAVVDSGAQTL